MKKSYHFIFFLACMMISCKKHETPKPIASKKYTITASTNFGGSISPGGGVNTAAPGSNLTYIITPNATYGILSLTVDSVPVVPVTDTYTFSNVQANHTIIATFAPDVKISIVVTNGTASSNPVQAIAGGSVVLTVTPNPTFHTDSVYINGVFTKLLAGNTTYTVNNITANETIKVTCTDALSQIQQDSIINLMASGKWYHISIDSRVESPNNLFAWQVYPLQPCDAGSYELYSANFNYQSDQGPNPCTPGPTITDAGIWSLMSNGKILYLNRPNGTKDSTTLVKVTTDSLVTIYSDIATKTDYRYHEAHVQ